MSFDRSGNFISPTTVRPSDLHPPFPPEHSYESLIPLPALLTPGEILDRYYSNTHQRGNTALVQVPVPARAVDLVLSAPRPVVEFRAQRREGPSKGLPTTALFGHGADPTKLQGAGDFVLDELRGSGLQIVVPWPGYQSMVYSVQMGNGGRLTRLHLAKQLGMAYAAFFRRVERYRLSASAGDSHYKIALHQGTNRRPDSPGIQFMQVHFVSLCYTACGKWVVHVEIA